MRLRLKKKERLKHKKQIEQLFLRGSSITVFPLRLIYLETFFTENVCIKSGFSVSKRNFKKAVDRNTIKRLMREAYRLNKNSFFNNLTTSYAFMFLYLSKEKPKHQLIKDKIVLLMERFLSTVESKK